MDNRSMMEITQHDAEFGQLVESCMKSRAFDVELYTKHDVKRGVRDKYYSTTKGKLYKRNLMKQKGGRKIW